MEVLHSAFQSVGMFARVSAMNSSNGHDALQPTQPATADTSLPEQLEQTKLL